MYWVYYCPLRSPLLLSETQTKVYKQMMGAVNKGAPYVKEAFWKTSFGKSMDQ